MLSLNPYIIARARLIKEAGLVDGVKDVVKKGIEGIKKFDSDRENKSKKWLLHGMDPHLSVVGHKKASIKEAASIKNLLKLTPEHIPNSMFREQQISALSELKDLYKTHGEKLFSKEIGEKEKYLLSQLKSRIGYKNYNRTNHQFKKDVLREAEEHKIPYDLASMDVYDFKHYPQRSLTPPTRHTQRVNFQGLTEEEIRNLPMHPDASNKLFGDQVGYERVGFSDEIEKAHVGKIIDKNEYIETLNRNKENPLKPIRLIDHMKHHKDYKANFVKQYLKSSERDEAHLYSQNKKFISNTNKDINDTIDMKTKNVDGIPLTNLKNLKEYTDIDEVKKIPIDENIAFNGGGERVKRFDRKAVPMWVSHYPQVSLGYAGLAGDNLILQSHDPYIRETMKSYIKQGSFFPAGSIEKRIPHAGDIIEKVVKGADVGAFIKALDRIASTGLPSRVPKMDEEQKILYHAVPAVYRNKIRFVERT